MGIWSEKTQLVGSHFENHYAITLFVFTLVPLVGLLYIWFARDKIDYNGSDKVLRAEAFSRLGFSNVFLVLYFFFRSLDILLGELQVTVALGYEFTYAFTRPLFGVGADLMILFVVLRMFRYIFPVQGKTNRISGIVQLGVDGLAILLLALALYQWSVSIALWTLYLNDTSGSVVDSLVTVYDQLVTAFNLLYLIISVMLWGNSLTLALLAWTGGMPSQEAHYLAIGSILVARSLTEAIVQIRYELQNHTVPVYEPTVHATIYGLLSIVLYYLVAKQSEVPSSSMREWDVLRKSLQNARKDLSRRRADAARGGPPYPESNQLLGELRASPLKYFSKDSVALMTSWRTDEVSSLVEKHTKKVLSMR